MNLPLNDFCFAILREMSSQLPQSKMKFDISIFCREPQLPYTHFPSGR